MRGQSVRTRMRGDQGVVAVVVAIMLIVFLGFAALVVDMGYNYTVKRQLQAAADAAALAGCQELILGAAETEILDVAREYAETHNSTNPGDGLAMVEDFPDTQVGTDFVQVTVQKPSTLFFGHMFAEEGGLIRAQAKARVAYLTGMRGIVPWAVPILRVNRIVAALDGNTTELTPSGTPGAWSGTLPAPTTASGIGYPVTVTAYNGQTAYPDGTTDPAYHPDGVPEVLDPAAAVTVVPAGAPIRAISLSQYYLVSGLDTSVIVTVEADTRPTVRFDGKNYNLSEATPGVWRATLPVDSEAQLTTYLPLNVEVGSGSNKFTVTSAAVVVVRRSTYPIHEVVLTRYLNTAGETASVGVSVKVNDYAYGNEYELKVIGGGAEVGNFAALDLTTIKRTPNWRHPQHPSEYDVTNVPGYDPPPYYYYLENTFPFSIQLGDTIWTEAGGLSGPSTEKALLARFDGDARTFAQWEAADKPGTKRIVYVPVMEKIEPAGGTTPLRVVSFAAFYIEPGSELKGQSIVGRFIQYMSPSDDLTDTPPDGLYIRTPRLVSDGIF